jgi:hypothetical protein
MISRVHEVSFFCSDPRTRRLSAGRKLDRCPTVIRVRACQSFDALPRFPRVCFARAHERGSIAREIRSSSAPPYDAGTRQ